MQRVGGLLDAKLLKQKGNLIRVSTGDPLSQGGCRCAAKAAYFQVFANARSCYGLVEI
jgi:hypothetical protein